MARTLREILTPVPQILREAGHPDRAEAMEALLEPGGWTKLRESEGVFTTNVPLTIRATLRDAIKSAADADPKKKNLSRLVTKGYEAVLDGSWTPPRPAGRVPMASGDKRVVLNVTVEDALRKRLRERLPSLSEELGYRVTESAVAIAFLRKDLGLPDEVTALVTEAAKHIRKPKAE